VKVSDYVTDYLKRSGVRYVYGCIGGAATHLFDSVFKEPDITFVHSYHEQSAAFGASASAKYSGKLAAALVTSGPGATNLITGIADAYFDSTPVLFITGQVNTYDFKYRRPMRQYGFQEADIVSIVRPITKYSVLLDKVENVEQELEKAVRIATSGRPGPVLLDIPMDIQRGDIPQPSPYPRDAGTGSVAPIRESDLEEVHKLIANSKRPLMLVGGGCRISGTHEELVSLAEKLSLPVVVSLMGKDSFPHDHRLFAGFIGAYGNRYGNMALAKSDLLLVLGSRLDSRQVGNVLSPFDHKKVVQVDIDDDEIGHRLSPTKYISSDVREFLNQFLGFIASRKIEAENDSKWLKFIEELKGMFPPSSECVRAGEDCFHYEVMEEISNSSQPEDIFCIDIGQNQMLAAQVLRIKGKQRFITSGGMAPMGYALPAGIAISLETGKRAIVIAGDGGMQLNIQELNTVSNSNLRMVVFVLNNKSLGMIKQFQKLYFQGRYCDTDESSGYHSIDFVKVAEAYGIRATRIDKFTPDWRETIEQVLREPSECPILVEVDFDGPTFVYPKLEYDKPIDELDPPMTQGEKDKVHSLIQEGIMDE
jgi:acetolactate synthase-1/2/3 large subunit